MEQNASTSELRRFKVVLLGEGAVGKTSILLRYIENKFNPKHLSTLQASFMTKKLNLNGRRAELNIWDTAGQERFHALGPIYYRDSQGAVLVFDVTDEQSFGKVQTWVKELNRILGNSCLLIIVGNKTDLASSRMVTSERAQQYAQSVGALYNETSAKNNEGIELIFIQLAKGMLDRPVQSNALRGNRNVLLVDDIDQNNAPAAPTKRCC